MVLPWFHEYQMPRMVNEGVEGKMKTGERGEEILRKFEAYKRRLSRHVGARGGIYACHHRDDAGPGWPRGITCMWSLDPAACGGLWLSLCR